MPPQVLAATSATTVEEAATRRPEERPPLVLALASAIVLWTCFPPAQWSWLAWGALVPLLLLVRSPRSRRAVYFSAWAGGFAFWLLAIQWVRLTDDDAWFAWLVMAAALSVWWPGFLLVTRMAVRGLRLPLMVAAPAVWVGLEYVRAHVFTGFAWYYVAHTQHKSLALIQMADVTGALGVSFLIVLVNAWIVDLLTLPLFVRGADQRARLSGPQLARAVVVAVALAATIGYGTYRVASARFHDGPRLALLQSDIIQRLKMGRDSDALLMTYQRLIEQALRGEPKPDLIVWPETSYPKPFVRRDPALSPGAFASQAAAIDPDRDAAFWTDWEAWSLALLHRWTDSSGVPMLVGTLTYDFDPSGFSKYNTAVLFEPRQRTLQRYAKIHLVPFGEYIPFIETLPWLTRLTPYQGATVPSLAFGQVASRFTLGKYRFATAICFEDTIPQAVRRFFQRRDRASAPDVVINLSNDGWFRGSSELDMHLGISAFRAVENRVPIARSVNTGMSALIDGNGRILECLPTCTSGVLSAVIPLDGRDSLYSMWGDWFGIACLTLTILLATAGLVRPVLPYQPA